MIFPNENLLFFCQSGDGGAFILDENADVVGLLRGAVMDDSVRLFSLMTETHILISDIKARTGCDIRLPTPDDQTWAGWVDDLLQHRKGYKAGHPSTTDL